MNKFYTAEPQARKVSKQEFLDFIKSYPRPLDRDVYCAYDPPLVSYNDFELANRWPASIVAITYLYDDDPSAYFYEPEEKRKYEIIVNHEELFNSKTGYKEGG